MAEPRRFLVTRTPGFQVLFGALLGQAPSQLIQWSDGHYTIRLVYFRRRCGEDVWEYGSQTTLNASPEIIKALFEKTLEADSWFTAPAWLPTILLPK